jgi:hypothetical protein
MESRSGRELDELIGFAILDLRFAIGCRVSDKMILAV